MLCRPFRPRVWIEVRFICNEWAPCRCNCLEHHCNCYLCLYYKRLSIIKVERVWRSLACFLVYWTTFSFESVLKTPTFFHHPTDSFICSKSLVPTIIIVRESSLTSSTYGQSTSSQKRIPVNVPCTVYQYRTSLWQWQKDNALPAVRGLIWMYVCGLSSFSAITMLTPINVNSLYKVNGRRRKIITKDLCDVPV